KALLFGGDADSFELDIRNFRELQQEVEELNTWRRKGPIGKLHNIITYIRRSPQRIEQFLQIQSNVNGTKTLMIVTDNATRCNSTYNMLERGIALRDALDVFITRQLVTPAGRQIGTGLQDDVLSIDDWEELTHLM